MTINLYNTAPAVLAALLIAFSGTVASADHNSKFGEGTGLDARGIHAFHIDNNTKSPENAGALKGSRNLEPGRVGEARRGAPSTIDVDQLGGTQSASLGGFGEPSGSGGDGNGDGGNDGGNGGGNGDAGSGGGNGGGGSGNGGGH